MIKVQLCFYMSRIAVAPPLPKFLAILCGCTAWFVSDLVENPDARFSHYEAHTTSIMDDKRTHGTQTTIGTTGNVQLIGFI